MIGNDRKTLVEGLVAFSLMIYDFKLSSFIIYNFLHRHQ